MLNNPEKAEIFKKIDKLNEHANTTSSKDALLTYKTAKEALSLSRENNYTKGEIYSLFYLGESLYRQGKLYDSIDRLRESLNLADQEEEILAQSMIFTILGNVHLYLKLYDLAFYYYRMAISACEELERFESQAMIFNNIGEIYRELGDTKKALDSYNQCLHLSQDNNFTRVAMYATVNIGVTYYKSKKYDEAIDFLTKSIQLSEELGNHIIQGFSLRHLGLLYVDHQEYDLAHKYFKEAMEVYHNSNDSISQARLLRDLAELFYRQDKLKVSLVHLNQALVLVNNLQDNRLLISIYDLFSTIYMNIKEFENACNFVNLSIQARHNKEIQEKEHRLKSIDFQIKAWDAMKESKAYQEMNKRLREKTDSLEKATNELKRINEEIKALSDIDGLTKIANRIKLDSYAQSSVLHASKHKCKVCMMIIDIDHFKEYNDFYGHLVGDEALIKLANILSKSIEGEDALAARFGGDEFVLIINDCDLTKSKRIARKIVSSLKRKKIKHEKSKTNEFLTVSIGINCEIPKKNESYALMMDFADQALYQAKEKGRNQIEVYN